MLLYELEKHIGPDNMVAKLHIERRRRHFF
jgi:hypothetical protein